MTQDIYLLTDNEQALIVWKLYSCGYSRAKLVQLVLRGLRVVQVVTVADIPEIQLHHEKLVPPLDLQKPPCS